MRSLNNIPITVKLPAFMVLLAVAAVVGFGLFVERRQEPLLIAEASEQLVDALASNTERVESYLSQVRRDLLRLGKDRTTIKALSRFSKSWKTHDGDVAQDLRQLYIDANPHPDGDRKALDRADDDSVYSAVHGEVHGYFRELVTDLGYDDLLLIDADGNVVYSVAKQDDFSENLETGVSADTGLGQVFGAATELADGDLSHSDFAPYAAGNGQQAMFVAVPVKLFGYPIGVVALRLSARWINEIAQKHEGMGDTGTLAFVGPDLLMRNDSAGGDSADIGLSRMDLPSARAALAGEAGTMLTQTSFGVPVVQAFHPVQVFGETWAAIANLEQSEALQNVTTLRRFLIYGSLAVIVIASLSAFLFSTTLTRPLFRVTNAISGLARGDLDAPVVDADRRDEIGHIAARLEDFRGKLNEAEEERVQSAFRGAAFSASTAAIMMLDEDFRILHANAAMSALLKDLSPELEAEGNTSHGGQLVGCQLADLLPADLHGRVAGRLGDRSALPAGIEAPLGDRRLKLELGEVRDNAGKGLGFILEMRDVTGTFHNMAVLNSIDGNQVRAEFTIGRGVVEVNETLCTLLHETSEDLLARPLGAFIRSEGATDLEQRLHAAQPVFGRFLLRRKDGSDAVVEGGVTPVKDGEGVLLRHILIATDVTEASRRIAEADRVRSEVAAAQSKVVDVLRNRLGALAEGDLTVRIETAFAEEYEQLRADFNAAAERLRAAMLMIAGNADEIRGGVAEISSATEDLSARTERQAATLEETAAALDQLTSTVRAAAEGASEANRVVETARRNAETSGEVVQEAVGAMGEIAGSSKHISKITEVIDDIAYQTNLLALNAGVEAARAGEAGRGFAVVASEVRALAQRSSDAAREINELISSSGRQVQRGVDLVGQAGDALRKIVSGVIEISRHVSEIAESSHKQSAGLAEINEAMGQLDQVTQQNAAMFEETTTAGRALSRASESLGQSIARFSTGVNGTPGDTVVSPAVFQAANSKIATEKPSEQDAPDVPVAKPTPGKRPVQRVQRSSPAETGVRAVRSDSAAQAVAETVPEPSFEDEEGWKDF